MAGTPRLSITWPTGMDGDGSVPAPTAPPVTPGWQTSEFWATAATIVANITAVLAATGWLSGVDIKTVSDLSGNTLTGLGAVVVNGFALWKYIASRTAVKKDATEQATIRLGQHLQCVQQAMRINMKLQMQQAPEPAA